MAEVPPAQEADVAAEAGDAQLPAPAQQEAGDGQESDYEEADGTIDQIKVSIVLKALGFSKEARVYLTHTQAIDSLSVMADLDDDEVYQLCKVCRKPGGTKAGTARTRNGTDDADHGIPVGVVHETNFKLATFFMKLQRMKSRPINHDDITTATVRAIKDFKTELSGREDPGSEKAPKLNDKKRFEFFDSFKEFLGKHTGSVSMRPLAYVVREKKLVDNHEDDIPFGQAGFLYRDHYHEIEHRAPIVVKAEGSNLYKDDHYFLLDNVKVWRILYDIIRDTHYLPYIKKYVKKQDGRAAYWALYQQLLGKQAINNYATESETKLQTLNYDGQKRKNWGFERYVTAHMEQHAILDRLKEHGHNGLSETTKIRLFVQGITDPNLLVCKLAVSAIEHKGFDAVLATYRTHIQTTKSLSTGRAATLNVSTMSSQTGNRTRNNANRPTPQSDGYDFDKDYSKFHMDDSVYYKQDAWAKLSKGQRNYLRQKREMKKRKGKSKRGDHSSSKKYDSKISSLMSKVAELETKLGTKDESDTESTVSTENYEEQPPKKQKKTKIIRQK